MVLIESNKMIEVDQWGYAEILVKLLTYSSSFLAAGSVLFLLISKPSHEETKKFLTKTALFAALFGLVVTLLSLAVQAGRLIDEGWAGMFDYEMLLLASEGPLGASVLVRTIGLVLVIAIATRLPARMIFAGLGALLIASSFALIGHATKEPRIALSLLITVHLLFVSFWFGALLPLYFESKRGNNFPQLAILAERFGKQASLSVPLLFLAGVIFAWLIVGSFTNLITSQYGLTLLIKLGLISFLLLLAALNKLRIVPAIANDELKGAKQLRQIIRWEILLFLVIFLITATLTSVTNLPTNLTV